jgi:hypothetical protein
MVLVIRFFWSIFFLFKKYKLGVKSALNERKINAQTILLIVKDIGLGGITDESTGNELVTTTETSQRHLIV